MTVSLSHISDIRLKASREQAENFRELIVSYSEDPRVIPIKLADRLEVMRRLEIFPREKWRKKSWRASTSTPKSPTNWVYTTSRANPSKTSPCAISNPRTTSISPTNWPRPKANAGPSSPRPRTHHAAARPGGRAIASREPHCRSSRSGTRCAATSRSGGM